MFAGSGNESLGLKPGLKISAILEHYYCLTSPPPCGGIAGYRRFGHQRVAAFSRTIPPFVPPAAPVRDEANATIAIRFCAFHDTSLKQSRPPSQIKMRQVKFAANCM